jgi:hypothetical protein
MADQIYIDETGVIVPDTGALQTTVENEYKAVFGQDLIVTPNTPQGVLITAEVSARSGVLRNNAALANQINPNLAGGVFLDAIWALTGGGRTAATYTLVPSVDLLGLPGTLIPAGSQAALVDGTLFESVSAVTLDLSGTGSVDFQAVEAGPVAVNVGALTQIITGVLGWDSVTNTTAGTPGNSEESDLASRSRRKNDLGAQGVALPVASTSALYDTDGVRSLQFRENYTDADATIDGIFLTAHSIWACVDGGTDDAVATALFENKSLGCGWNGAVSVDIVAPATGQIYLVQFDRPTPIAVTTRLYVRNLSALTDVVTAVQNAILDYANGLIEGESGFVVGGNVSAFELAGAVNRQAPGIFVQKCEVSLLSPLVWSTDEIALALDEIATITQASILVYIV